MAYIDKIYANREQYEQLKRWARNCRYKGRIARWSKEDFAGQDNRKLPVMRPNKEDELFLFKHCPLRFVRETLCLRIGKKESLPIHNRQGGFRS